MQIRRPTWYVGLMQLPAGYAISVTPKENFTDYTVKLKFNGKEIGSVNVVEASANCAGHPVRVYETHSNLDQGHRGKGLGLALYSEAIAYGLRKGYTVTSSYSPSALAQRVWRSKRLAEAYLVSRFARRWWVSRVKKVT